MPAHCSQCSDLQDSGQDSACRRSDLDLDNFWGIFSLDPGSAPEDHGHPVQAIPARLADVVIDLDSSEDADSIHEAGSRRPVLLQQKARWHFAGAYRQMVRRNRRLRTVQVQLRDAREAVQGVRRRMHGRAVALLDVSRHLACCNEELLKVVQSVVLVSGDPTINTATCVAEHKRLQRRVRFHGAYVRSKAVGRARYIRLLGGDLRDLTRQLSLQALCIRRLAVMAISRLGCLAKRLFAVDACMASTQV